MARALITNNFAIQPALILVLLFFAVSGHESYRNALPNASSKEICKSLGHTQCIPGGPRNNFGTDFAAAGYRYTKAFCEMDSDGDGYSNGAELGDPCCVHPQTDGTTRSADLSNPGDASSTPKQPENRKRRCFCWLGRRYCY